MDSFAAARALIYEFGVEETKGRVAVLNMANDRTPGGGWLSLSTAQVIYFYALYLLTLEQLIVDYKNKFRKKRYVIPQRST
jgi:hypothetical protein